MLPRIALWTQPIVAVGFDATVGVEWLSREVGHDTAASLWRWAMAHQAIADVERCVIEALVTLRQRHQGPFGRWWINLHPDGIVRIIDTHPDQWQAWQRALEPVGWELLESPGWDLDRVHRLVQLGSQLSLDDWGNHLGATDRLVGWPFTWLKLDVSLVRQILNPKTLRLLAVLNAFIDGEHQQVIAEGIETAAQWAAVQQLQIALAQGFWIARPVLYSTLDALMSGS